MTLARKICRQLGSDIIVESTLGQGSRFSFRLQVKVAAEVLYGPVVAPINKPIVTAEMENASALPWGTSAEIGLFLKKLEDPLAKLQPKLCQDIAKKLNQ